MQWKQTRYRLEWLGVKALATLIPRLPRRGCAMLANAVGTIAFALDERGRRVALANIAAALGDRYSAEEQVRIGRESYQYFARTMLDLFWTPSLLRPGGEKYIDLVGKEIIEAQRGKPTVVLCAHYAGVEWASIACGMHELRGCILTEAFKNPLLDKLFTDLRTCTGQKLITQEMSMLRMLRMLLKGEFVGLLIDLNLPPSQSATVIESFGMKICSTYLHAVLAERTGARLVPMTSEPFADGRCRVEIHAPLDIPAGSTRQEITQIAWKFFENLIREKPALWMWGYKHWRYQPKAATHPYPFYAHQSGKFEKLMREIEKENSAPQP